MSSCSSARDTFRILQAIKKILHTCLPCKLAHNHFAQEIVAPLPAERVKPLRPFEVTPKKCYIALFTCDRNRALYLEVCCDMTTDKFLLAFQICWATRPTSHDLHQRPAKRKLATLWTVLTATTTHQYLSQRGIILGNSFPQEQLGWEDGWYHQTMSTEGIRTIANQ